MPADPLSNTLSALADPTRRGILARLTLGDASVSELAEPFEMSLAAVSKHLKVLEGAGLISRGREAQWRPCHLEAEPLESVSRWLDDYRRFWERSFEGLNGYLQTLQGLAPAQPPTAPARSSSPNNPSPRRGRAKAAVRGGQRKRS